jgi:hypothetical protein
LAVFYSKYEGVLAVGKKLQLDTKGGVLNSDQSQFVSGEIQMFTFRAMVRKLLYIPYEIYRPNKRQHLRRPHDCTRIIFPAP